MERFAVNCSGGMDECGATLLTVSMTHAHTPHISYKHTLELHIPEHARNQRQALANRWSQILRALLRIFVIEFHFYAVQWDGRHRCWRIGAVHLFARHRMDPVYPFLGRRWIDTVRRSILLGRLIQNCPVRLAHCIQVDRDFSGRFKYSFLLRSIFPLSLECFIRARLICFRSSGCEALFLTTVDSNHFVQIY